MAQLLHFKRCLRERSSHPWLALQAAVPKFMQLKLQPASGNMLPANAAGTVTQRLTVTNTQHGQKALAMRLRIAYSVAGANRLEQSEVKNFPQGL